MRKWWLTLRGVMPTDAGRFNNEGTFSMKKDDGSYEIDPWFGKTC